MLSYCDSKVNIVLFYLTTFITTIGLSAFLPYCPLQEEDKLFTFYLLIGPMHYEAHMMRDYAVGLLLNADYSMHTIDYSK